MAARDLQSDLYVKAGRRHEPGACAQSEQRTASFRTMAILAAGAGLTRPA